jgi:hypothetical protein
VLLALIGPLVKLASARIPGSTHHDGLGLGQVQGQGHDLKLKSGLPVLDDATA